MAAPPVTTTAATVAKALRTLLEATFLTTFLTPETTFFTTFFTAPVTFLNAFLMLKFP